MDSKAALHEYLRIGRDAMLWKLDGLSEYAIRRPMTPTGTNLLGLIKHLTGVEIGYLGATFGRPYPDPLPWQDSTEPNVDMWARPEESRDQVVELYQRAQSHADVTIETLDLTAVGEVPPWPPDRRRVTLQQILGHLIAETHRHAGHADIVRELIDGSAGRRSDADSLGVPEDGSWRHHRERVEQAARDTEQ